MKNYNFKEIEYNDNKLELHHNCCYNDWKHYYSDILKNFKDKENVKTILDLGANTGSVIQVFTEYFNNIKKIYAIEPVEFNYNYLLKKLSILNKDIELKTYKTAIYYGKNKTNFYGLGDGNVGGMHTIDVVENYNSNFQWGESFSLGIEVECNTLENIIPSNEVIDICKIDVEGSEWNIIENSNFIKNNIKNIFLEYHLVSEDYTIEFLKTHLNNFIITGFNPAQQGIILKNENLI